MNQHGDMHGGCSLVPHASLVIAAACPAGFEYRCSHDMKSQAGRVAESEAWSPYVEGELECPRYGRVCGMGPPAAWVGLFSGAFQMVLCGPMWCCTFTPITSHRFEYLDGM